MYPGVHAKNHPERPAIIMARSGRVISYGELDAGSNRLAQLLWARGLRPGDGIALFLENHPRFYEICWAAQRSGLYYTAISSRLTTPEVDYIVNDCGAQLFISSRALAEAAGPLADALPRVHTKLMLDGPVAGFESYEACVDAAPAEPLAEELEGSDMLYSSGTTGRPKGIKPHLSGLPVGQGTPLAGLMAGMYGVDESSVYISPAPLYHAAPLRFNLTMQRIGATCLIMEKFDAAWALELIEKHRATHSQWVPTMFVRMLKLPPEERARWDLSSLRVAIHAAAPCPVPVKQQMIEWWGPILYEYYAGTENNGYVAIDSEQWLAHPGSVGRALVGAVHIVGEDGEELPAGEPGTVWFEGGGRFEYHNAPEKTAESYNEQGWSTLGDVGYLDEEGYLYLTDRKAHMIISGGVNIYPQEAENLLVTHPKVADVAVIGVPNEDFGEEVKAVVQPLDMADAGPALEAELIAFCRAQLADVKCPRSVDFEAELPRHPTGKLYKRLLKDRYWTGHETRIV